MTILRSTGPVISTRRSAISAGTGAIRQSASRIVRGRRREAGEHALAERGGAQLADAQELTSGLLECAVQGGEERDGVAREDVVRAGRSRYAVLRSLDPSRHGETIALRSHCCKALVATRRLGSRIGTLSSRRRAPARGLPRRLPARRRGGLDQRDCDDGADDEQAGQHVERRLEAVVERRGARRGRRRARPRSCSSTVAAIALTAARPIAPPIWRLVLTRPGGDARVGALDTRSGSRSSPGRTRGPCRRRRARRPGTDPRSSARAPAAASAARPRAADATSPAVSVARTPSRADDRPARRSRSTTTVSAKRDERDAALDRPSSGGRPAGTA